MIERAIRATAKVLKAGARALLLVADELALRRIASGNEEPELPDDDGEDEEDTKPTGDAFHPRPANPSAPLPLNLLSPPNENQRRAALAAADARKAREAN
jgi:hypothetical protein